MIMTNNKALILVFIDLIHDKSKVNDGITIGTHKHILNTVNVQLVIISDNCENLLSIHSSFHT